MDRRIKPRVIDTGGAAKSTLIEMDACEVWWINVSVESPGTAGMLNIYDGFDAGGKLVFQGENAYIGHFNFIPPIPCDEGLFVYNDAHVACYTIGYRPKKWGEGKG
jgi:hypothetical protein